MHHFKITNIRLVYLSYKNRIIKSQNYKPYKEGIYCA